MYDIVRVLRKAIFRMQIPLSIPNDIRINGTTPLLYAALEITYKSTYLLEMPLITRWQIEFCQKNIIIVIPGRFRIF